MKLERRLDLKKYSHRLEVIDAHTEGEFCRVVTGGFEEPKGNTMIEKKNYMAEHYDKLRTGLMHEPRGHRDMFGAFLVEPVNKEAEFGVIFMDTGGYLNMCGHCSIGAATVILEGGLKEMHEGENEVVLEAPAGIIRTKAMVKNGKVQSVTITNVPAFVFKENQTVNIDGKDYNFTISFGGSFFAIVDAAKNGLPLIEPKSSELYVNLGMKMLEKINKEIPVKHPLLDITSVDLVEFYCDTPNKDKADKRNCVVFGDKSIDRSPCGTGTSAKLATLYHNGEIKVGEKFRYESFIGSLFIGEIKETTKVAEYDAVIPMITGAAYITGIADYLFDEDDKLTYGFVAG